MSASSGRISLNPSRIPVIIANYYQIKQAFQTFLVGSTDKIQAEACRDEPEQLFMLPVFLVGVEVGGLIGAWVCEGLWWLGICYVQDFGCSVGLGFGRV